MTPPWPTATRWPCEYCHVFTRAPENQIYSDYAEKLIGFFAGLLERNSSGHYYLLAGISDYLLGETGPRQYGARGVLKATAEKTGEESVAVRIDIAPGWHINSNQPYQDYLIPTTLSASNTTFETVIYPEPIDRQLGFARSVLSLYEGAVILRMKAAEPGLRRLQTQLQACSDKVCLPPETLTLTVLR